MSKQPANMKPCLRVAAGPVVPGAAAVVQGLTLVHSSAQSKHILWDTLGA